MVKIVPRFVVAIFALTASIFPAVEIGFFAYETYETYSANENIERDTAEALLLFQGELDAFEDPHLLAYEYGHGYWKGASKSFLTGDLELAQMGLVKAQRVLQGDSDFLPANPALVATLPPKLQAGPYHELLPACDDAEIGYGCAYEECYPESVSGVYNRSSCSIEICRPQDYGLQCEVGYPLPTGIPACVELAAGSISRWCAAESEWQDPLACIVWFQPARDGWCQDETTPAYQIHVPVEPTPCPENEWCDDAVQLESAGTPASFAKIAATFSTAADSINGVQDDPRLRIELLIIPGVLGVTGWAYLIAQRRESR